MFASLTELPGIGDALARRIEYNFGPSARDKVAADPYKLTEIHGIGFHVADRIARETLGVADNNPRRIRAGIDFWFSQRALQGHTAATVEDAILGAEELLGVSLGGGLKDFFVEDGICAPYDMRAKEEAIARKLGAMVARDYPELDCVEDGLYEDQVAALRAIQRANIFVLTGAPGVGKTATVKSVMLSNLDARILLCAPTGKAAKRLEELTGARAATMHRALEPKAITDSKGKTKFVFTRNEANPLDATLIVIDEASMIDTWLMFTFLKAVPAETRLLLVGDPYQLPSVGPGNVLGDIIASKVVPSVELTQIKRTAPDLLIARNCARIKGGEAPITAKDASDWFFFERRTPAEIADTIVELVSKKLPAKYGIDPLYDIQTITALREKTDLSTAALNRRLRTVFNPTATSEQIERGDRVICTRNDYGLGVFNGDLGMVLDVDRGHIRIAFETPEREVECRRGAIGLELAYALTVHKFQGSEAPFIIIPIHRCLGPLVTKRNWIYTAVSRARRATILVGSQGELSEIVKREQDTKRMTMLRGLLVDVGAGGRSREAALSL